ncbi:MAG TPA: hypothetical protein DD664_01150 [Janibacter terrae]|nr:hypothetical protein [Janibacter terrae]
MSWIEVVGYIASALVATSFFMRSLLRLRWVSLVGSALFMAYGLLIGSWPVVFTNVAVAVANVIGLRHELASSASSVTLVPIDSDAPFLVDYLAANADEITNSQPGYHPSEHDKFVRLVNRDGLPAGVLIGEPAGKELLVKLDYVSPAYRDSSTAKWLFGAGRSTFTDAGFTRLVAKAHTSLHRNYLELVGFRPEGNAYVLDLTQ